MMRSYSSEVMITELPEEKPAMPPMPGGMGGMGGGMY